ncbi:serine/threonine-protein kinase [Sorangium sp. So ce1182]|uniref:serine/threonine-protein kinase n=1 Tax=Sorangium sp. So ce1182 TaxID=3133334 RepID=UPI003F5DDA43
MGTAPGLGHGSGTKIDGVLQPPSASRQPDPPARDSVTLSAHAAQLRPAAPRAARQDPRAALRQDRIVAGRYRLLHPLGRGAMGEVWRAHDSVRRFDVALKFLVLPRQNLPIDAMERFRFEAQVSAQLGRKTDRIVAVHDAGEDPETGPYLVMEYVRGRSLRQLIQEQGPVPAAELAALLCQIGEALSVAHDLGIVHRDIKPSNLMLREGRDGRLRAKIADFGIAKWIRQDLAADFPRQTAEGVVLGTPAYLSPEHTCDGHADTQLDMWALAVVAHVALTGQQPFEGRTIADVLVSIVTNARPPLSTLAPGAPPELEAWFERAFALNPEDRFPSIKPMIAAFVAAAGAPDEPPAPESQQQPAAPARRSKLHLAAASLVLALGLGLALATAPPREPPESAAALRAASDVVLGVARRAATAQTPRAPEAGASAAVRQAVPAMSPVAIATPPVAVASVAVAPASVAVATPPEPAPNPAAARPARASAAPRSAAGAPPRKRATDTGVWKSTIF